MTQPSSTRRRSTSCMLVVIGVLLSNSAVAQEPQVLDSRSVLASVMQAPKHRVVSSDAAAATIDGVNEPCGQADTRPCPKSADMLAAESLEDEADTWTIAGIAATSAGLVLATAGVVMVGNGPDSEGQITIHITDRGGEPSPRAEPSRAPNLDHTPVTTGYVLLGVGAGALIAGTAALLVGADKRSEARAMRVHFTPGVGLMSTGGSVSLQGTF